jgi:hypothetical protein
MIRSSAKRKVKQGSSYSGSIGVSRSASNPLHLVAQLLQLGDNAFTLIALNLDPPVFDRSPCPAPLFERGGEFPKRRFIQCEVD